MRHRSVQLLPYLLLWFHANSIGPCDDQDSEENGKLLQQISDARTVAKVIAKANRRMLVIDKAGDYSAPCSYSWWMDHEVQGTVLCEESVKKPSFLQVGIAEEDCPVCTPKVNDMVNASGYFQSMAALCKMTPAGQPRSANRVLVIGLGAGVLPAWLLARTQAVVEVVDISDAVVQISHCFGLQQGPQLSMHVEDGRKFLRSSNDATYDTLILDAFDDAAQMPQCLRSVEFFQIVAGRLVDGGMLMINLLKCGSERDITSCGSFADSVIASVQQVFPKTYIAQAAGSGGSQSVLVAQKDGAHKEGVGEAPDDIRKWFLQAELRGPLKASEAAAFHDDSSSMC